MNRFRVSALIFSYLITFAIFNIGGFEASDILLGVIFFCLYLILTHPAMSGMFWGLSLNDFELPSGESKGDITFRRIRIVRYVLAVIATVSFWIYMGQNLGRGMDNPLFVTIYGVLTLSGVFLFVYYATGICLTALLDLPAASGDIQADVTDAGTGSQENSKDRSRFPRKSFLIFSVIIFACLLPLFILNYPGTMTVDSFDQLEQVMGIKPFMDHHPWAHTLVIGLFYNIGYSITGSVYGGIATYTIAQMIIMSLSVGYGAASLKEAGIGRMGQYAVILCYVLYPYHTAYAITMWKDIIFSAMVLVMSVTLFRICRRNPDLHTADIKAGDLTLFIISGIGVCLLRHNGLYAFIAVCVIMILTGVIREKQSRRSNPDKSREYPISLWIAGVCVIIAAFIFNGPVEKAFGIEKVDFAHNIPIPLQQVARVVSHNGEISSEDMEMIERINVSSYLRNHYEPGGADNVMQWVVFGDSEYLEEHKGDYLALWIRLGIKNPRAYVDAYIDQTKGYYTTMMPEQKEYYGILPNKMELYPQPFIGGKVRMKINEICSKIGGMLPVYGILYSPGAAFMISVFGICLLIIRRRYHMIIPWLPALLLLFTILIATPLRADLRYAYPLMLCLPFLMVMTICG